MDIQTFIKNHKILSRKLATLEKSTKDLRKQLENFEVFYQSLPPHLDQTHPHTSFKDLKTQSDLQAIECALLIKEQYTQTINLKNLLFETSIEQDKSLNQEFDDSLQHTTHALQELGSDISSPASTPTTPDEPLNVFWAILAVVVGFTLLNSLI